MVLSLVCRGDIPFCTEECRREQIEMDEEMERKESSTPKKVGRRGRQWSPRRGLPRHGQGQSSPANTKNGSSETSSSCCASPSPKAKIRSLLYKINMA
ncbi:hypothetical protein C2845_PM16G17930 [Panicum miliaceum]|uniref:FLZ-type domain-containing protein n=1 Tax=Panicum miliaceum TaxID=4540 RepID=A0A3L6PVE5_PANMI|nr:hypothetical protein C2845_PM16G17930 [Panicum miliaceum]